jgi:hypothetical protein
MRRIRLRRPSPALVVACLALGIALGGTSYAAIILPANSVGTVQLRTGAVTSVKVKDGSLALRDLRPDTQLGLKGDPGTPGVSGLAIVQVSSEADSDNFKAAVARCPSGKKLIGGGAGIGAPANDVALNASLPADDTEWTAIASEVNPTTQSWSVAARAICATVP